MLDTLTKVSELQRNCRTIMDKFYSIEISIYASDLTNCSRFIDTLNLYLLDAVSGAMIFSIIHKRVRGPVHIVHSENWIVYSYFNEKSRRTEIASLELYEGKIQSNTIGTNPHCPLFIHSSISSIRNIIYIIIFCHFSVLIFNYN